MGATGIEPMISTIFFRACGESQNHLVVSHFPRCDSLSAPGFSARPRIRSKMFRPPKFPSWDSWDRRGSLLSAAKQAGWYQRNASAASLLIFSRSAPYRKPRMRCRAALMEARCARVSEVPPRSPRALGKLPSYPRRGALVADTSSSARTG
jgi:hypothetical protein